MSAAASVVRDCWRLSVRPEPFCSIGRKVGLVFVALIALLAVVCAAVLYNLQSIRLDASQLLEETREARLSSHLRVEIEALEGHLAALRAGPQAAAAVRPAVEARLQAVREILHLFDMGVYDVNDPSRAEHQTAEDRLTKTIHDELRGVEQALTGTVPTNGDPRLDRSRRYAQVLADETHREAERANADLLTRSRTASWIMISTVLGTAAALAFALWIVRREVVEPIRALRDRAERLGRGDFSAGPGERRGRDEIGALARSFEEMAARLSATHDDLRERVETRTRELMRAARYADIGVLAAGVAHEINNPLASIASSAEGLQRRLERGSVALAEQADYLRTIGAEAYRARNITSRLLELARQDRRPQQMVDLARVFEQVELLSRHQLEQRAVRLVVEAPQAGPLVQGDAGELLQLIVNLVLNARDASPKGGTVWLRARQTDAVEIVVDDAGPGVAEDVADRIFDPFFTTKDPGAGTGLGLSLVAAIAQAHGGTVAVGRSPAKGARFTVRLPATAEPHR
jgi:signal transduction histidine kinase